MRYTLKLKAELYYTDVDTGDLKRREIYLRYHGDDDKYGKHMDEEIKNQLTEFGILDYYTQDGLRRVSEANKIRPRKKGMKTWNSGLSWDNEVRQNISKGMIAYWIQRKDRSRCSKNKRIDNKSESF